MTTYVHTGGVADHAGPPVVFVHGAGSDHTAWRFQTRWLAHRGYRVLAPDLPGHGRSEGEPKLTIPEWGEWLASFLAERVTGTATVVGHSMGALIAMQAATVSDRIATLVLVNAGRRMPVHDRLLEAAENDLPLAAAFIAGWSMPAADPGGHPEPGMWEKGGIERLVARSRPGVLAADLAACVAYEVPIDDVVAPAAVISGSRDRMIGPGEGEELASILPKATFHLIPGAGHDPMVQLPALFNRLLAELLGTDGKVGDR